MKKLLSILSATAFLAAGISSSFAASGRAAEVSDADVIHVLDRLSFGPSPGDIEHVKKIGIQKYIDEQFNARSYPDPVEASGSQEFSNQNGNSIDLIRQFREFRQAEKQLKADNKDEDAKNLGIQFYAKTENAYNKARLMRAIKSPRQLEEVMTDFWYNHFNVFCHKEVDRSLIGPYEEQAIRPFALGNFKQLVVATCHHPAMLYYLDNWQNTAPNSPGARGKLKGLNENYARELMELHTLGVDGGYTQDDVIQLAHVLTGLGLPPANGKTNPNLQPIDKYGATFDPNRHDTGDKTLLGHQIKGAGAGEIDEAIDILVKHPATAHHIAFQLAQYFVADTPPPALVNKLAAKFSASGGDIKQVLQTLFASQEFWDPQYEQNKFKSPFRYVVSCFRASGSEPQRYEVVSQQLRAQGQLMYGCLTPDGYKNVESAWLSPDALLKRVGFATQFATAKLRGGLTEPLDYQAIFSTLGGDSFFKDTGPKLASEPEKLKAALLLGSPEFMRY